MWLSSCGVRSDLGSKKFVVDRARDNYVYRVAHPHCRAHCGVLAVASLDASAAPVFTGRSFGVLIVRVLC